MSSRTIPAKDANCLTCRASRSCILRIFAQCDTAKLENFIVGKRRVARNASVFHANESLEKLYVVRLGQFKLVRTDRSGTDRVVQFHMPGDLVGLDAIASGKHKCGLMALENGEVCEVSYDALRTLMGRDSSLQSQFLEQMSLAIGKQYGRASILSRSLLDERFALFLLHLSNSYSQLGYSSRTFRLAMSRSDIGSYLATSIETVSRIIARFNSQRAATILGRTVEIHDFEYLVSMLSDDPAPRQVASTFISIDSSCLADL